MTTRRKTALIVILLAGALVAAFIVLAPAFFKIDRYRPQVISYLQEKTGKQIEIGSLGLTFFPISVQVDKFGVKNPPFFPPGYVLQLSGLKRSSVLPRFCTAR